MFRDLKEYQEIAKIYAEKVSKPEDLEENRNKMAMKLRQEREANKPAPEPKVKPTYQSNRDKLNKQRTELSKGRAEKQFSVLKPKPGSQGRVSRSSQNMSGKPKPMPTTAEIRAKNPKVVPGTRTNEIGAQGGGKPSSGDLSMFKDKKPEVSKLTKQGKPRTKAQMMAAKRIADGKSISDVKAANTASMKAKAAERFKAFKAKRDAGKMNEDITPYDIVLEYLLSSEQVATIEEANYVMTEMDAETIQGIVEEQKKKLDEVAIVPAVAGIVAAGTLGAMGINAIRKMNKNKEKMDKGETFKKGSTMDNIQKKNQMYKDMGIAK